MNQRERFEAWAGCSINLSKDSDGEYWLTSTRTAWLAWQEAERQAIERCAKACKELDNEGNSDDYRAAARWCAERIRGLGADDATRGRENRD